LLTHLVLGLSSGLFPSAFPISVHVNLNSVGQGVQLQLYGSSVQRVQLQLYGSVGQRVQLQLYGSGGQRVRLHG
jgi:hypothetical protein